MFDDVEASDFKLKDMIEASEPGNAERLRLRARDRIHWVDTWGTWIVYRDGVWVLDTHGVELQAYAKKVAKYLFALAEAVHPGEDVITKTKDKDKAKERSTEEKAAFERWAQHLSWARKSNTEFAFKRMVILTRDLPGIRIHHGELDANPFLFNMRNGTLDFKSGMPKPHDPTDLITKMAPVMFDPEATCPMWDRCLDTWQPLKDVQKFLSQITGSGLIGEPVQNLFVNHGLGRNGKGTFYKRIQLILGEYAGTAPADMIVEKKNPVHGEEMARLRGCRLLLAPETSAGDRLDETTIKNLTGGDLIHARHLYSKPFDFLPTHTAFLHTNHEPGIKGTDAAIWNRVVKIPWETYIPADQRDTSLDEKLESEHSGILNWLILGCLEWIRHGLQVPPSIRQSTEGYRADQDHIGSFIRDCLGDMITKANELGPVDYIPASTLRKRYEEWCEREEGIRPWSAKAAGKELVHKGWTPIRPSIKGKAIRAWDYNASRATHIHQDINTNLDAMTPESHLTVSEKNEEKISKGVKWHQASKASLRQDEEPWEQAEEELEQTHREWLRQYGYPVPPTNDEIQAYMNWTEDPPEEPSVEELKKFWNM